MPALECVKISDELIFLQKRDYEKFHCNFCAVCFLLLDIFKG